MRFLIVVLLLPILSRAEDLSAILVLQNDDEIIYAKSYTEVNKEIQYVDCFGVSGRVVKKIATIFLRPNLCLQVSSEYQVKALKQVLATGQNAKSAIVLTISSKEQQRVIEKTLAAEKIPNKLIKYQQGMLFDISIPHKDDPKKLESVLPLE